MVVCKALFCDKITKLGLLYVRFELDVETITLFLFQENYSLKMYQDQHLEMFLS